MLKNVTALAAESAQNLTSQATQLLEKLDGEMNQQTEDDDENEEDQEVAANGDESEKSDLEKPEVQQVVGVDGETFFVTKTPTKKKSQPKTESVVEEPDAVDKKEVDADNSNDVPKKELVVEAPVASAAVKKVKPSKQSNRGDDSPNLSGLLQEEVVGLKSLITELTNKMDSMQSKHAIDLESKQKEVQNAKKEVAALSGQLKESNQKVELLEKQTNILQLQSNLKEIKESRVSYVCICR